MVFTVTTFTAEIRMVLLFIRNTSLLQSRKVSLVNLLDWLRTIMVLQAFLRLVHGPKNKFLLTD